MPGRIREPRKILAVRNDRFGEFLLNIPAIRALKETYPQARVTLAVSPEVYDLAGALECVDEVAAWNAQFRKELRKKSFDACIILNPTKEAHAACFWAGIPVRAGYSRKWGFLLTHKIKDTKYLGDRHEVDCNLELAALLGAKTINKTPEIKVDGGIIKELSGRTAVAIHPFTSDLIKQWPVERFMEMAKRIAQELNTKVVLVGKTDDCRARAGAAGENKNIMDLINKTSLIELAQVLKQCRILITCDSGPMHLAASVGIPVVALFRNDLQGKTCRRWGPCGKGHLVIESNSLNNISVDDVFSKIKEKLI